jgi:hypothetical protein
MHSNTRVPAFLLGLAGLIPFISLGLATWLWPTYSSAAGALLKDYAALILAFLGALHWGAALHQPQLAPVRAWSSLTWGVVPALLAWWAVGMPVTQSLFWLLVSLIAALAVDRATARWYAWPSWFIGLRLLLTVGACLGLSLGLYGLRGA